MQLSTLLRHLPPVRGWPKGPTGHPVLGHLMVFAKGEMGFLESWRDEYGDFVPLRFGPLRAVLINRADYIEEVLSTKHRDYTKSPTFAVVSRVLGQGLVTSDGELWRRQRQLIQPAFHRERIAEYARVMVDSTERMLDGWSDGEEHDLLHDLPELTLRIVTRTLFHTEVESEVERAGDLVSAALRDVDRIVNGPQILIPGSVPTTNNRNLRRTTAALDEMIYSIIERRRASDNGEDGGDLLSVLLRLTYEEGGVMSNKQLRDEVLTLFIVGHETTAVALCWSWYLLTRHRWAQEKLQQEVDSVLRDRAPTIDDYGRLAYTQRVLKEAMRLFPPAPILTRQAAVDTMIGDYSVPAGAIVFMSPWLLHHDPRYFTEPERFDPERWDGPASERLPRLPYFPFGAGPRMCIGHGFALTEGTLLLAAMAQRYTFEATDNRQVKPRLSMSLRPQNGLKTVVRRRSVAATEKHVRELVSA